MSLDIPPALGSAQVEADGKAGSPGVGRDLFKIVLLGIAKFSAAFILIFLLTDMDPALRMPDSSAEDQRYVRKIPVTMGRQKTGW